MFVKQVSPALPVCDFAVSGATVTVRGYAVDCDAFYAAGQRVIEIRSDAVGAAVVGGTGPYLAVIKIPAQRFTDDESGPELVPLNPASVVITLWPAA